MCECPLSVCEWGLSAMRVSVIRGAGECPFRANSTLNPIKRYGRRFEPNAQNNEKPAPPLLFARQKFLTRWHQKPICSWAAEEGNKLSFIVSN